MRNRNIITKRLKSNKQCAIVIDDIYTQSGITLVALVITTIVLVILAGVNI